MFRDTFQGHLPLCPLLTTGNRLQSFPLTKQARGSWAGSPGKGFSSHRSGATCSYRRVHHFCVHTMTWLPASGIFNMCTDVMHAIARRGPTNTRTICTVGWLGERSLTAPGNETPISTVPGVSVNCPTNSLKYLHAYMCVSYLPPKAVA